MRHDAIYCLGICKPLDKRLRDTGCYGKYFDYWGRSTDTDVSYLVFMEYFHLALRLEWYDHLKE